jgi:hypothetical protein
MNNIKMNQSLSNKDFSSFKSVGYKVTNAEDKFPEFSGIRVMMMPFYTHNLDSVPESLNKYKPLIKKMLDNKPAHIQSWDENTAYLTIDEGFVKAGVIQRKSGLHVDGMYNNTLAGAWGGGGGDGGGWGSCTNGMLLCSNTSDLCVMYTGHVEGVPINDGDCEHLKDQLSNLQSYSLQAGDVVWADGLMLHESLPAKHDVNRQFIRISLPNNSPWFEGYTENPLGVKPSGKILKQRRI